MCNSVVEYWPSKPAAESSILSASIQYMTSLYSVAFRTSVLFTPLEQFYDVAWVSHSVLERVEPYYLFVTEREFDASTRYTNVLGNGAFAVSETRTSPFAGVTLRVLFWAGLTLAKSYSPISFTFSHLFFLGTLFVLTGGFFTVWFADFFYGVVDAETGSLSYSFAPSFDISLYRNESRISLFLAFFLLGGGEEEDDEDFLLSEEGDLEVVEDVVAPLFFANLGKNFEENGALYLKVCAIFGFVLANNLRGRVPYSDTATSSLGLTFWVSLAVFASLVALRIQKHGVSYLFSLFVPAGCPFPLLFILVPIEAISYSFRLVSLAVRLFANRRAGHTLRKVLIGFSYVFLTLGDLYALAAFLPGLAVFALVFLERAVAGIQAYIFTVLTCLYLKDIYVAHLLLMPQLELDLLEDFLFFAFAWFLLGIEDTAVEENVVNRGGESYLASFYLTTAKSLREEVSLIVKSARVLYILSSQRNILHYPSLS